MTVQIQECWVCGKKLTEWEEEVPFHCSKECQEKCLLWNYKPDFLIEQEGEIQEEPEEEQLDKEEPKLDAVVDELEEFRQLVARNKAAQKAPEAIKIPDEAMEQASLASELPAQPIPSRTDIDTSLEGLRNKMKMKGLV